MYIWLKTVENIDLSVHCAKCLIGKYDGRINKNTKKSQNLKLKDKIYYLCGVSEPYNWNKNFHLAFKPKEGSNIEYSNNGINVVIEGAEMLPINEKYIDIMDPYSNQKEYRTCRNWQFANYLQKKRLEGEF